MEYRELVYEIVERDAIIAYGATEKHVRDARNNSRANALRQLDRAIAELEMVVSIEKSFDATIVAGVDVEEMRRMRFAVDHPESRKYWTMPDFYTVFPARRPRNA